MTESNRATTKPGRSPGETGAGEGPAAAPTAQNPPPRASAIRIRKLRERLGPWRVLDEDGVWPAGEGVRREEELAGRVASDAGAAVRLWRGGRSLVVTRRETRLPSFESAADEMESLGWPVVVRDSGGTAVPHLPGALQVSLFLPRRRARGMGVEDVYHLLCEPVRGALQDLGLTTGYGQVAGSFCDGRFNLVHGGKKLAGTAQRWRGAGPGSSRGDGYILGHMVLFVEGDVEGATRAVNRLLRTAGGEGRFREEAHGTVVAALATGGVLGSGGPPGSWGPNGNDREADGASGDGEGAIPPAAEPTVEVVRRAVRRRLEASLRLREKG